MKKMLQKLSILIVCALIVNMFSGVTCAQAASSWSFKTGTGEEVEVDGTITMVQNEYQDFNLYKNGKEIKKNNLTYKVTWSSSNPDAVWVDSGNGKLRVDKFQKLSEDATARITATIRNRLTGAKAERGFTIQAIKKENCDIKISTVERFPTIKNVKMTTGGTIILSIPGVTDRNQVAGYSVEWLSTDKNIAEVIGNTLYARKAGTATVTAKISNQSATAEIETNIEVNVCDPVYEGLSEWDNEYYRMYGENYKRLFSSAFLSINMETERDLVDSAWDVLREEHKTLNLATLVAITDIGEMLVTGIKGMKQGSDYLKEDNRTDAVLYLLQEMKAEDSVSSQYAEKVKEAFEEAEDIISKITDPNDLAEAFNELEQTDIGLSSQEKETLLGYLAGDVAGTINDIVSEGVTASEYMITTLCLYGAENEFLDKLQKASAGGDLSKDVELLKEEREKDPVSWYKENYLTDVMARSISEVLLKAAGEKSFIWIDAIHAFLYMQTDMMGVAEFSETLKATYLMSYLADVIDRIQSLRGDITENFESYSDAELIAKIEEYENAYEIYVDMIVPVLNAVRELEQYGWNDEISSDIQIILGDKYSYSGHIATAMAAYTYANPEADPRVRVKETVEQKPVVTITPTPTATPILQSDKRYGVLSSNGKINVGMNPEMTGGTYGAIYPGAKLDILSEHINSNGVLVYRVYSHDLSRECYVSAKYITLEQTTVIVPEAVPENDKVYGTLTATRYNVGINANFTGGTLGEIKQGAQLEILEEVTNASGVKVYRVYSPDLNKECYVSARYVTINDGSSKILLANIAEGVYAIHPKCALNSSLDVAGWNADNGANLQIWETTKLESNQLFRIKRENGYYVLQSEFSQKMIDVSGAVFESQNNVQLYEANGSDAQKWIITDAGNGYYMLIPYGNMNLALDVSGGGSTNGSNMWLYEINKSDAQLFKLERYYGSTEGLSRYECFSRNASIVLEQIKNGTSEYINVGDKDYKKLWTWYYQRASSHDGAWCDVFAHYVLCLAGVDTLAYKGVTYSNNQTFVPDTRKYYKDFGAYTYGNDVYDAVKTGDLILMRNYGHIGVVYVEGDNKYVVHGNYSGKVCVHELGWRNDVSAYCVGDKTSIIDGYVSMETFLSKNTEIEVSRELPTETYQIGNYILGGVH